MVTVPVDCVDGLHLRVIVVLHELGQLHLTWRTQFITLTKQIMPPVYGTSVATGIITVLRIRIRDRFFLDPGSQTHISDNFLGKKFYISLKIGQIFFLQHFKNKIVHFCENYSSKNKVWQLIFFLHPCLSLLFLDPGSGIRDPGWVKIRIRDKHPGSATLHYYKPMFWIRYRYSVNPDPNTSILLNTDPDTACCWIRIGSNPDPDPGKGYYKI